MSFTQQAKNRLRGSVLDNRVMRAAWGRARGVAAALTGSEAKRLQVYRGYEPADLAVFDAFPPAGGRPERGYVVDFLGVRTRIAYGKSAFAGVDGKVLGTPAPHSDSFHAETVEYVGLLRSALSATGRYVAMELGAGWGPWLVAGAAAARRRGVADVKLYGVEADPGHFAFMHDHFRDNGLDPAAHVLLNAAVGATAGRARWPKVPDAAEDWGSRPVIGGSATADGPPAADSTSAADPKSADEGKSVTDDKAVTDHMGRTFDAYLDVEVLGFGDLLRREPAWDLVHIDIQGWEAEVCRAAVDELNGRVRRVVIGTHSRKLDGELVDLFFGQKWVLENEKPAKFRFDPDAASLEGMTWLDGTQVWRNPRLLP